MKLFSRNSGAAAPPSVERSCRGCGNALDADQLACLTCGAVDAPATGRERRWLLPTGATAAVALFLVTSASFATTTALRTGDPKAVRQAPPVAQAPVPPASGDGAAPSGAIPQDPAKGPDLGDLPDPPAGDAAPPDAGSPPPADDAPADDGADTGGGNDSGDSGSGGSGGGSGSGGSGGSTPDKPDKPDKPAVTISEWPDGDEGYTVILGYKFNTKSEARAKAREVAEAGLPAGIIDSDKYASLEPGSWLVFVGRFESSKQAEKANDRYSNAGYPGEPAFVGQSETPDSEPGGSDGAKTEPQP
jgi:hypothetical protein